jgi:hypothetical protein
MRKWNYRAEAEEWERRATDAGTLEGHQLYLLHAIVNTLFSIDDTLKQLIPPDTIHVEGYGNIPVFTSIDEVIDHLMSLDDERR